MEAKSVVRRPAVRHRTQASQILNPVAARTQQDESSWQWRLGYVGLFPTQQSLPSQLGSLERSLLVALVVRERPIAGTRSRVALAKSLGTQRC